MLASSQGVFAPGDKCVVIDDLITTGDSKFEVRLAPSCSASRPRSAAALEPALTRCAHVGRPQG